jgi:hypothetical protein
LSRQDKDQNEQNGGCRNDGYGQFSLSDTIWLMRDWVRTGCSGCECHLIIVTVLLGSRQPLLSHRHCVWLTPPNKWQGGIFFTSWVLMPHHIWVCTVLYPRELKSRSKILYILHSLDSMTPTHSVD